MAQTKQAAPRCAAPAALATEARALADALHILDDLAAVIAGAELLMAQGAASEESRPDRATVEALLNASKVATSRIAALAKSFDVAALAADLARARYRGHVRGLNEVGSLLRGISDLAGALDSRDSNVSFVRGLTLYGVALDLVDEITEDLDHASGSREAA